MRRRYEKLAMNVERFQPNVAVAACDREWNGEIKEEWTSQAITCNRMGTTTDYIFAEGTTGCQYKPCHMIYVEQGGTYTIEDLNSLGLEIVNGTGGSGRKGSSSGGGAVTVPAGGGYVLCWENGNHYGLATPDIVKIMISSF